MRRLCLPDYMVPDFMLQAYRTWISVVYKSKCVFNIRISHELDDVCRHLIRTYCINQYRLDPEINSWWRNIYKPKIDTHRFYYMNIHCSLCSLNFFKQLDCWLFLLPSFFPLSSLFYNTWSCNLLEIQLHQQEEQPHLALTHPMIWSAPLQQGQ